MHVTTLIFPSARGHEEVIEPLDDSSLSLVALFVRLRSYDLLWVMEINSITCYIRCLTFGSHGRSHTTP